MGDRLADVVAQIQNVRQLHAVVTAMRGIAAARAQRGRALLAGIDSYGNVIGQAIGRALSLLPVDAVGTPLPPRRGGRGLVAFCAEQGFAGAFSERILDVAMRDVAGALTMIVGTRGAAIARERGLAPDWTAPMAAHVDGIPALANRLADALYDRVADVGLTHVDIVFARTLPDGIQVDRHSLLPLDLARFARPTDNQPPLTTLTPSNLLERLAAEYVYAELCEAAMHAFAAENEARMMAMAAAKSNIENKLSLLALRENQLRQEDITTEIVELAAGAEAMRTGR